ncbi:MAG: hypothetical protein ABI706_11715 [Ilumatobacteraceae bacterium]
MAGILWSRGHDVDTVLEESLGGRDDPTVASAAIGEGLLLLTPLLDEVRTFNATCVLRKYALPRADRESLHGHYPREYIGTPLATRGKTSEPPRRVALSWV